MAILRHVQATLLLPTVATIVIPAVIPARTPSVNVGWSLAPPFHLLPILVGIKLVGFGLVLMIKTISLFATVGQGTLAPWDPTRRLVVRGIYRRVRNPMISGALCVLLGKAVFLGSFPIALWFLAFLALNLVYIPLIEEPGLERRFGDAYLLYKRNVPRWIPRSKPWNVP